MLINSMTENNKLEEEIINLRNENKILKEQLSQTNNNSATIHNDSYAIESEVDKLRRLQLSNMFESMDSKAEDEYSDMSDEDIAKGYMEMGDMIAQENMEFNQNI